MKSNATARTLIVLLLVGCEARPPIPECPKQNDLVVSVDLTVTGTQCGVPGASLVAISEGGAGGNRYQLDKSPMQESPEFNAVRPGAHIVTVMDRNYCKVYTGFTIYSGISFQASIKPIIDTKCAQSGCHDGTALNFLIFDNLKRSASDTKTLTQNRTMPKQGYPPLTDLEIEMIACWVDDGAPNN